VEIVIWHGIKAFMTKQSGVRILPFTLMDKNEAQDNVGLCKFQVQRLSFEEMC
jgi:hypothetical protein